MIPAETGERPRGGATEPFGPAGRGKYARLFDGNDGDQIPPREVGEVDDLLGVEPHPLNADLFDGVEDPEAAL